MTTRRLAVCMTILNVALLAALVASRGGATAPEPAPVLRGSALELVDAQGQVRARMNVEESGEVVLRMLDDKGQIRVKLGANADGSALLLANDTAQPGVQVLAGKESTGIRLANKSGATRVVTP
jgi:hypothetical protein